VFLVALFPAIGPASAAETGARIYVDEDYGLRVAAPAPGWQRYDPALLSLPGEVCRAWSPDGTTTISLFVQKPEYPVHPRDLLTQSVYTLQRLSAEIVEQEVKEVAGMRAMWLVVAGPGTGAALTGEGSVKTWQHWVAIPREEDVVVLLLNAPDGDFREAQASFLAMLDSLLVGGSQTEIQKAPEPPPEPQVAANLDFEAAPTESGFPSCWSGGGEGYEITVDQEVMRGGAASGRIGAVEDPSSREAFGALTQGISAEPWRGKRVRLSGWLRTREATTGGAGLWMRVDPYTGPPLAFDNMSDRPVTGSTDWDRYEVVLEVPEEAKAVYFGALLSGGGTLWVDDLALEEVPGTVQVTERGRPAPAPTNLDFEAEAVAPGAPPGWDRTDLYPPTGGEGYEVVLDRTEAHGGEACAFIRSLPGRERSFGTLTQSVSPEGLPGSRVRLTGWLRTENVQNGFAGLWLRIDGRDGHLAFDNMSNRGVRGTTSWSRYEVVLDRAEDARAVVFGALLVGEGSVWVDDLHLEAVVEEPKGD
jgi:hypothetical protein